MFFWIGENLAKIPYQTSYPIGKMEVVETIQSVKLTVLTDAAYDDALLKTKRKQLNYPIFFFLPQ